MTLQLPNVKPMLAGKLDYGKLTGRYPIAVQPKVDGIRALIHGGRAFSRTLKLIPNREIQAWCKAYQEELEGFDGELIVGDPFAKDAFQVTTSGVMSEHGIPNFRLHVFDMWNLPDLGFADRYMRLSVRLQNLTQSNVSILLVRVPTKTARDNVELASEISNVLAQGWEGGIVRDLRGLYKSGRSTTNEGLLLKWKEWVDEEAEVVGFEELKHNENGGFLDNLGHLKRSSHKESKVPGNMLGALVVKSAKYSKTFNVGSGFDMALRQSIWDSRNDYIGRLVKFKHFPIGQKDVPRQPIFLGFRHREDM